MMSSAHASNGMPSASDFFTMWHSGDTGDHPEAILAYQSLVYVYPGGELRVDVDRLSALVEWPETADISGSSQLIRPYRAFVRQFQLDEPVEADAISITYTDGVLTVCVPKLASSHAE